MPAEICTAARYRCATWPAGRSTVWSCCRRLLGALDDQEMAALERGESPLSRLRAVSWLDGRRSRSTPEPSRSPAAWRGSPTTASSCWRRASGRLDTERRRGGVGRGAAPAAARRMRPERAGVSRADVARRRTCPTWWPARSRTARPSLCCTAATSIASTATPSTSCGDHHDAEDATERTFLGRAARPARVPRRGVDVPGLALPDRAQHDRQRPRSRRRRRTERLPDGFERPAPNADPAGLVALADELRERPTRDCRACRTIGGR